MRRSEREISLSAAERLAGGLAIAVRLRIGIELVRALAAGAPADAMPRSPRSRLVFERVVIRPDGVVSVKGEGDDSGAALLLWEVLAGRPLGTEPLVRLHDIVDDMPADTDDVVMGALRPGASIGTATELLDELVRVAEPYAVALDALWDHLPSAPVSSRKGGAVPTPRRPTTRSSRPPGPASTRAGPKSSQRAEVPKPEAVAAPQVAPPKSTKTGTLPSMKAVVPPQRAVPPVAIAESPRSQEAPAPVPPAGVSSAPELSIMLIHSGEERLAIANALRRVGYPVVACGATASALARAANETPICVVCDSDLPDGTGRDVARKFRKLASPAADAPFVLFASPADADEPVPRFRAGADIYLAKPVSSAALVRQVDALIDMSARLRSVPPAAPAPSRAPEAALTGDIRLVGIATMLTLLEMERRTGSFLATSEAWAPTRRSIVADIDPNSLLELELARGCVAGARAMGVPARPIEVVRAMMRLGAGRFSFKPAAPRDVDAPSLRELLAEAARLEDEEAAGHA
jgi:DNA-binding response OmpR family regulator